MAFENNHDQAAKPDQQVRLKQAQNGAKTFKILSIDGGGIKGLYTAALLEVIEEKTGRPIGEFFEMITGTSTGGIIALALSRGVQAKVIKEMYIKLGPKVFKQPRRFSKRVPFSSILNAPLEAFSYGRQAWWPKHSNKELRQALEGVLGSTTRMRDAGNQLLIPAFNLTEWMPKVFKSPIRHGMQRWVADQNTLMVDVALATSAAPTFLPAVEINGQCFCDGGVYANNPSMVALSEASNYYIGAETGYDRVQILSIANASAKKGWPGGKRCNVGLLNWIGAQELIDTTLDGQAYGMDYYLKKAAENTLPGFATADYVRIPPFPLSIDQSTQITLDNASKGALTLLESTGRRQGEDYVSANWGKISSFFDSPKTYSSGNE